ncbi:hypothetical protein AAVH_07345 [Aphelenchoides avenae]|nr:hypothetical protein AAVH_07345 [Aphelenchus avenae]
MTAFKFTFRNVCPLMLSKTTGRLQTMSDLRDGGRDEPECLADSTNHTEEGEDVEFDIAECPRMQDFESKDPCILFDSYEEP